MAALEDKLVQYIDEAYAMEQNVLRLLDGMIGSTDDAQMKRLLERHRKETVRQAERLEGCLSAHGATPSKVKQAGGLVGAVMKSVVDVARGDKAGRNARDGFATEHMEIASYELLERVAKKAGDKATVAVARQNRQEEEAMARAIASKWNKIVDLSLEEEGIKVTNRKPASRRRTKAAASARRTPTTTRSTSSAGSSTRSSATRSSTTRTPAARGTTTRGSSKRSGSGRSGTKRA
jgi:ferritin-like metal-binding protein YciE